MPYARNADLPAQVRNPLPNSAQTLFRTVVNAQLRAGKAEDVAHQSAWAAVSRQYMKPEGSDKWIHKRHDTLYVKRIVENADEIIQWAKEQGFETTQVPSSMHATVAYSKAAVEWPPIDDDTIVIRSHRGRVVEPLGDDGAVVLKFQSPSLSRRWQELCDHGCSWDHESFQPHVTITWDAKDIDLSKVQPYTGQIVLGPEVMEPVDEDWQESAPAEKAAVPVNIFKVDKKLGLVFGWAIVSKQGGQDYFDLQGDNIPEDAMLEAAFDFMKDNRTAKIMHKGEKKGTIIFAWPLTTELAKAMGLKTQTTGLMIGVKFPPKVIKDIESGNFTGFSIGGMRLEDEEVS